MNKRPIVGELPVKILQPEVKLSKPIHPKGNRKVEYVDLLEYSVLYRMFAITDNQAKNLQPLTLLCNYTRKPRKGQEKI